MIDISGLDKGAVLAALHNGTMAQGLGVFHDLGRPMTPEEGATEFQSYIHGYIDYCHGRPIKCDLSGDQFEERLYDRDAGSGQAHRVIADLRIRIAAGK